MKNEDKKRVGALTPTHATIKLYDVDRSRLCDFEQATIERCPHDGQNPYAQISRELIRNKNISMECGMLLIYLLSMSDKWVISMPHLRKEFEGRCGERKLYKLMNEAIEAGYIYRERIKVGNLGGSVKYYLSENANFKKSFRRGSFRHGENRDGENDHTKERTREKNQQKKEEKGGVSTSSNPLRASLPFKKKIQEPKQEVAPRVMLDPTQQESLLNKLGGSHELRRKCYEKLSDWKIGKNKTDCKNDYLAICNWVIDAVKDASLSSTTGKTNNFEKDQEVSIKIKKMFPTIKDITMGYNYIEFNNGREVAHLKFGEKDFSTRLLQEIMKRNLSTVGLFS